MKNEQEIMTRLTFLHIAQQKAITNEEISRIDAGIRTLQWVLREGD